MGLMPLALFLVTSVGHSNIAIRATVGALRLFSLEGDGSPFIWKVTGIGFGIQNERHRRELIISKITGTVMQMRPQR